MHMNESELLKSIASRAVSLSARFPRVIEGPGDDCAVLAIGGSRCLLTVDQLVEGRHFRSGTSLDLVARKAIARSVSDIAAMAGTPLAALASGALPAGFPQDQADLLCGRLAHWAESWDCPLIGGDIASCSGAKDPMVLTVTVVGEAHPTRGPVRRRDAAVGDNVYVTGALGASFETASGLGRHLTFEPRITAARALAETLGQQLHAMMDISDGLGRDAGRIARASGVRLALDAASFPCAPAADWQAALRDGEDYELLFCAAGPVPDHLPDGRGGTIPVTRVGVVTRADCHPNCLVRDPAGIVFDASESGWNHEG